MWEKYEPGNPDGQRTANGFSQINTTNASPVIIAVAVNLVSQCLGCLISSNITSSRLKDQRRSNRAIAGYK